ncbi:hypothetical protein [Microbacterium kyungheense]|uniref:Uncharacterized protein n=1 Tax=Microbacterium kyungheense TaxID=1263636 RepID=A0A543EU71_9MICO|nr:hypothetical protein [Microbacterium kyungheense]TQM25104.1 hypothetical protein FB391_2563 [Microbacterium kyungheense]
MITLRPHLTFPGSRIITCRSCDSSLGVYGNARLLHHSDGSHTVEYSTTRRPTWREVQLAPLKFTVERARVDYGRPVWLAYRTSDLEYAQTFRTQRGALRYALSRVAEAMRMADHADVDAIDYQDAMEVFA